MSETYDTLNNLMKGMERRIKEKDLNVRNLKNKLEQEKKKKRGSSGWGAYYNCKKKLERFLGRDIELREQEQEVDNTRNLQREERNRLRDAEIQRVRNERIPNRLTQTEINDRVFREYELYGADRAEQLERELEGGF
tara:strand:+ start:2191 stop:2601 length:411 start_codon:yes stop_codon:yes gene_type:complete